MTPITLTADQEAASDAFFKFLNSEEKVFVLTGGAGCGKSTLVNYLLERLPKFMQLMHGLNPEYPDYTVMVTATTNKACEALQEQIACCHDVSTIHSTLRLVVFTDYKTKKVELVQKSNEIFSNYIVFVDEAGFVDHKLKRIIESRFAKSKIIYLGDADQLVPVGNTNSPVFNSSGPKAELSQVVRQAAGNPIIDAATMFRHAVRTGEFAPINTDPHHVIHCDQDDFEKRILEEFNRPDWKHQDSKVLLWTNDGAVDYNNAIRNEVQGQPEFQVGDYAICNSFVKGGTSAPMIKANTTVQLQGVEPAYSNGVAGHHYKIKGSWYFMPLVRADRNALEKTLHASGDFGTLKRIDDEWIDLRAVYACTINKSQGSTYDKVFIDLNNMRKCYNGNTLARLLYVAVSRARHQVVMTGDLA